MKIFFEEQKVLFNLPSLGGNPGFGGERIWLDLRYSTPQLFMGAIGDTNPVGLAEGETARQLWRVLVSQPGMIDGEEYIAYMASVEGHRELAGKVREGREALRVAELAKELELLRLKREQARLEAANCKEEADLLSGLSLEQYRRMLQGSATQRPLIESPRGN